MDKTKLSVKEKIEHYRQRLAKKNTREVQNGAIGKASSPPVIHASQIVVSTTNRNTSEPQSSEALGSSVQGPASAVRSGVKKSPTPKSATLQKPTPALDPEALWDLAYDALKAEDSELLNDYESILSRKLTTSQEAEGNVIAQDNQSERRVQMKCLLDAEIKGLEKAAGVERKVGNAIRIVLSAKSAIGTALDSVTVAALAWAGVCVALQFFLNPIEETKANRDGIIQVIYNMKWYSSLSKFLLEDTVTYDNPITMLRSALADLILHLYKELLRYMVKSICAYNRNKLHQFLRGMAQLDDWKGELHGVNVAEKAVTTAVSDYTGRQSNSYLALMACMHATEQQSKVMQQLCITDMGAEIQSLEERKDQLVADAWQWILDTEDYKEFVKWPDSNLKQRLWIKGDAGKGKTMLLVGIIRHLEAQLETHPDQPNLSYFLCQGTNDKLNTATAVMRGLIWMLIRQEKTLVRHVEKVYNDLGSTLFQDHNSFYNLKQVFFSMIKDDNLKRAFLIVDALDECLTEEPGLPQLLQFINETSRNNDKIKWLISSRNDSEIGSVLAQSQAGTTLSLELNSESVAGAVKAYIEHKMDDFKQKHRRAFAASKDLSRYNKLAGVLERISKELLQKSNGTFLWVALVFKQMEGCRAYEIEDEFLKLVKNLPPGLDHLYSAMMRRLLNSRDATLCTQVLLITFNAYRPLHISELAMLAQLPDLAIHEEIVAACGLLTIRQDVVYFIHQSANDYLGKFKAEILPEIFPSGLAQGHRVMVTRSLDALSDLKRNIYNLDYPGCPIEEVRVPDPDPLASVRYSCVYWIDHLREIEERQGEVGLSDDGATHQFLKKHFLHWLEALSLISSISEGILAILNLVEFLAQTLSESELLRLVQDMRRFALDHRDVIQNFPLQVYGSALVFSPSCSLIRKLFEREELQWIISKPIMQDDWGACLQTFHHGGHFVLSVAFSPDGERVASASANGTVKVWNCNNGACLQTLHHDKDASSVAFSPDGERVASASEDCTVKVWNCNNGACLQTLHHDKGATSVAFSPDGERIASAAEDGTVKVWNLSNGTCLQEMQHNNAVLSVTFSPDGKQVVCASCERTVKVWDCNNGACLQSFRNDGPVDSISISPNGQQIATTASDHGNTVKVWDLYNGACLQKMQHDNQVDLVGFLPDGRQVAFMSGSPSVIVKIWNLNSGICLKKLELENLAFDGAFSPDGQQVATVLVATVKLWDLSSHRPCLQTFDHHGQRVHGALISPNGLQVASFSSQTIKLWDSKTSTCLLTLYHEGDWVSSVAFSPHGHQVASGSSKGTIRIWDLQDGACLQRFNDHEEEVRSITFSPDGWRIISISRYETVKTWEVDSGAYIQSLERHHGKGVSQIIVSPDCQRFATLLDGVGPAGLDIIKIWDSGNGSCLQTLKARTSLFAFSADGQWLLTASDVGPTKLWDLNNGTCVQILENIGFRHIYKTSFDMDCLSFSTDRGTVLIDLSPASPVTSSGTQPLKLHYRGYGLSANQDWITWNGRNVLFLPSEYRLVDNRSGEVHSFNIVIGSLSGRVLIFTFSSTVFPF
ncbi:WD40 repeat-like protein [Xylona heveae TC161]|uniref:WD40 repeat-like protein n=1 Tax=Xylona heveae (strain CBS 132557 / TC161) TaxID=1328760 RepID=A0A165GND9_XYLHT|nr:WD40 repeat-like protein [Xylona heveae TC161]KZF22401.1 WD40 repeat-like protein [Xylona heveae TC161]